jgi:nucleotide-binding universal stress UspA family protein
LKQAAGFDLVILGIAEEWGLESHLFGWRPERIARDSPASLMIVRRAPRADALASAIKSEAALV